MSKGISLITQLLSIVNYGERGDANYDIAKAILKYYYEIPKMTIYDLAEKSYVSPASITRFIKNEGFDSFKDLKQQIEDTVQISSDYSMDLSMAKPDDLKPILYSYTDRIKENIDYTMNIIDIAQILRICAMMHEAPEIAVFGLEFANLLGLHFQKKMASLNKFVQIGVTEDKQYEIANTIREKSAVLVLSLEGSYFYRHQDLINILENKHCKIIAITMNETSKLVNRCDEIVLCNKYNIDTEGRITLLYVIEILIMFYCINYQAFTK